jgi:hypothetical protein
VTAESSQAFKQVRELVLNCFILFPSAVSVKLGLGVISGRWRSRMCSTPHDAIMTTIHVGPAHLGLTCVKAFEQLGRCRQPVANQDGLRLRGSAETHFDL